MNLIFLNKYELIIYIFPRNVRVFSQTSAQDAITGTELS